MNIITIDVATLSSLREMLRNNTGKPVTVTINSGGGNVLIGQQMADAIAAHGNVTTQNAGRAESVALTIFMSGKNREVTNANATFMVHATWWHPTLLSSGFYPEIIDGQQTGKYIPLATGISVAGISELTRQCTLLLESARPGIEKSLKPLRGVIPDRLLDKIYQEEVRFGVPEAKAWGVIT